MDNDNFDEKLTDEKLTIEDFDGEFDEEDATLVMVDEEGNEVEYTIVAMLEHENVNYLLAIESEMLHEDEASATILKEVAPDDGEDEEDDMFFEHITDEEEFNAILELFQQQEDFDME